MSRDWYQEGYDRGYSIASNQDLPEIGEEAPREMLADVVEDVADAEEVFFHFCYEAESNNRDFSPFEFTAAAINELGEDSEEAWGAFDQGISRGFEAYWQEHCVSKYEQD